VLAFDVGPDGSLAGRRVFADLPGLHPDGLAVDASGGVWVGCYLESRYVRVLDGGTVTDVLEVGGCWTTGVALGGPDGRTLFLCSSEADVRSFFSGECVGRIDTARVDVPAALTSAG
jgi:sugar lactone lactonase YvrE